MDLNFPSGLELESVAGEGRRSIVYKARYRAETVALKIYRPEFVEKYRKKYNVNIADFEMSRNEAFRRVPKLFRYAAKPLGVIGKDGKHSLAFLQEFINGITLMELGRKKGGLPGSVLQAGEVIVKEAEAVGLHDLDLFYKNILVREQEGVWYPVIYDFNLMPQYRYPPNPLLAFMYRTGLHKKSHRDYRCIAQWKKTLPFESRSTEDE